MIFRNIFLGDLEFIIYKSAPTIISSIPRYVEMAYRSWDIIIFRIDVAILLLFEWIWLWFQSVLSYRNIFWFFLFQGIWIRFRGLLIHINRLWTNRNRFRTQGSFWNEEFLLIERYSKKEKEYAKYSCRCDKGYDLKTANFIFVSHVSIWGLHISPGLDLCIYSIFLCTYSKYFF